MKNDYPRSTLLTGKEYVPAKRTDIQETWQKFGWKPPHPTTTPYLNLSVIYQSKRSHT